MTTTIESCGVLCHCPDYMPDDRFDVEDYPGGRPCCWCKCTAIEHRRTSRQKNSTHDEALREQLEAARVVADERERAGRRWQEKTGAAEARVAMLEEALQEIKDYLGNVYGNFETCDLAACRDSLIVWAKAGKAIDRRWSRRSTEEADEQ